MDELLQQFEEPVRDRNGATYTVYLYGRSRPRSTWQGWLVFERHRDGRRFATPVETTQPNAQAVVYWATGLTDAYFEGALGRALEPRGDLNPPVVMPEPVVDRDHITRAIRVAQIERDVIAYFTLHGSGRVETAQLLDALPYTHADTVRALEALEKGSRNLVRTTDQGTDWLLLTPAGYRAAKLTGPRDDDQPGVSGG